MDHTIDELSERIKPRHLLDEVLAWLRIEPHGEQLKERAAVLTRAASQAAERSAHAVTQVVQRHPIPSLLVGAGVAWAIYESAHRSAPGRRARYARPSDGDVHSEGSEEVRSEQSSFGEKVEEKVEVAKEGLQKATQQVKETGQKIGQGAARKARAVTEHIAEGTKRNYQRARSKFVEESRAHPLSVGLGFLAAGVLVGLVLPHTEREDEWVGEAADRLKERAKTKGKEIVARGKNVATAVVEAAKESAAKEGFTSEPAGTSTPSGPPAPGTSGPPPLAAPPATAPSQSSAQNRPAEVC